MKFLKYLAGILSAICLIVALLIGSIEFCCFYQRDFFKEQYEREKSYEDVGMTLGDVVAMTDHMLDYLQNKNDDISYDAVMYGVKQPFFNERVTAHMVDVKKLNLAAVSVMRISAGLAIIFLMLMCAICFHETRPPYGRQLILKTWCKSMLIGTVVFSTIVIIGAVIAASDFDAFWIRFHHIFFTNDLWLLDPRTDYLINVTTEDLFARLVANCAIAFGICLGILLISSCVYLITHRKKLLAALLLLSLLPANSSGAYAADIASLEGAPQINSDYAILIDKESGRILYSKDADKPAFPASTTKVMTALLALENCELLETVEFTGSAIYALTPGASHIGMTIGETLTVEDCLYGLLLPSANEVANALAEHIDGSMAAFVEHMNSRAAELGCTGTSFANPNGLHNPEHTTTASDLAKIFNACVNCPGFLNIDTAVTHVIAPTELVAESRPMKTTHQMMRSDSEYYDERVVCGKTGHTDEAGGCLITYAVSGGSSLICIVLHADQPYQYTDTKALLDYGFGEFSRVSASTLSDYIFSNPDAAYYSYIESSPLPKYTIMSDELLLLPSDLSKLSWVVDGDRLTLRSGLLPLGELTLSKGLLSDSIYENGQLPIEKLPKIQKAQKTSVLPIVITVGVIAAVILILVFISRSRTYMRFKKKHSTHIVRNPGTKNIKI